MQSNAATITLSGSSSSQIRQQIFGHIQFQPDFKNLNQAHPYKKYSYDYIIAAV